MQLHHPAASWVDHFGDGTQCAAFAVDDKVMVIAFAIGDLLILGTDAFGRARVEIDLDDYVLRMEPDRDPAKRVEWNLLMGKHADRLGYTWLELGRRDDEEDGAASLLVEFVTDGGQLTLLLVLVALTTACASMQPKSGVAPNGEPLSIETWTSTRKETVSEKVGESDHYDSDGNYMGTSEQYQDKTVTHSSFHWQPMQGDTPISDEDFWRISGNAAKADHARIVIA